MRMRIVLVVLGLAFATMAIGQEPASPRAKLRTQVARLRAEVELLQIEHDADGEVLKTLFKEARTKRLWDQNDASIKEAYAKEIDRSKTEFLDKTIAFNEKKLELVDLEQRLTASR